MKNTKEYYDKTAKEMADKWYEDEYLLPYLKEFIEYLPEHPRVRSEERRVGKECYS